MAKEIPGYNGKILRANLSTRTLTTEELDAQFCRKYMGGAGFIAYYLWKELKPGIDALSPDNKLIFALGPVSGYLVPGASRNCIGAKSPLTGGIAKSEVGGFWMAELKRAGYDAIIIEGKAKKPVYLWVHDGEAEIRDASQLWGKETRDTEAVIRAELGDDHIQVAMIGQAGENLVRYACVMEGCHDAAGRGGLGAVMGSKNLKAIAARGHNLPPAANNDKVKEVRQALTHPHPISQFGTGGPMVEMQEVSGDLPIHNFQGGAFPAAKLIHSGVMKDSLGMKMEGCFACPLRCKKVLEFNEPWKVDAVYGGPEYETIGALGPDCGNGDVKAIIKGNERCNAYGLDTISAGSSIAFAIECYEKGLITKKDTGGLELKWGDAGLMLQLLEMLTRREGFGDFLAEGTARMAKKIGRGSEGFAMNIKGMEAGMHEPRIGSFLFWGFMLTPTGGDHCASSPDPLMANDMIFSSFHPMGWLKAPEMNDLSPRKVGIFKDSQLQNMLMDSMVVCQFAGPNWEQSVELLKGVTGWDTGLPELLKIAERIVTLMRLFNLREGLTAADDKLPARFYETAASGPLSKIKVDREGHERARKYYYTLMGWDANGVPLREKVEELELV